VAVEGQLAGRAGRPAWSAGGWRSMQADGVCKYRRSIFTAPAAANERRILSANHVLFVRLSKLQQP